MKITELTVASSLKGFNVRILCKTAYSENNLKLIHVQLNIIMQIDVL